MSYLVVLQGDKMYNEALKNGSITADPDKEYRPLNMTRAIARTRARTRANL